MIAELEGIKALLAPYGRPVFWVDTPKNLSYPYVLLWGSPGLLHAAEADGEPDDLDELLGVTTVAINPEVCLTAVNRVRSYLLDQQPIAVGRYVQPLKLADSRPIEVDKEVTIPHLSTHPAYAVDLYRLRSEPKEITP